MVLTLVCIQCVVLTLSFSLGDCLTIYNVSDYQHRRLHVITRLFRRMVRGVRCLLEVWLAVATMRGGFLGSGVLDRVAGVLQQPDAVCRS